MKYIKTSTKNRGDFYDLFNKSYARCAAVILLLSAIHSYAQPNSITSAMPATAISSPVLLDSSIAPNPLDDIFVALRKAALANDVVRAEQLAKRLNGYPEPAYVNYFRLRGQIYDSAGNVRSEVPDTAIESFLKRYPNEAISDRLRNDWLLSLGKRRDWSKFDTEYPHFVLKDDVQLKCYALVSRLQTVDKAQHVQMREEALDLLFDPKALGDGCIDLSATLYRLGVFNRDEIKAIARWALEKNYASMARHLATLTGVEEADNDKLAALTTLARTDPEAAWAMLSHARDLSPTEQGAAWGVIGQFLAKKSPQQALTAFRQQTKLGGNNLLSPQTHIWKVRMAVLSGDWAWVISSIDAMPGALRSRDSAWAYWYARALQAQGHTAQAVAQYQAIADPFNFYGQLAREELNLPLTFAPPTSLTDAEVMVMQHRPGFKRAQKFYNLGLRFEGGREWNWTLRGMSDRELVAAAEYAKRIDLLDRTVSTADRTRENHDFWLRYVMPYQPIVRSAAQTRGVDMAWVYGLIRQESRFVKVARSSVGAAGLMQVMPNTAKYVARKIGMSDYSHAKIDTMETNIMLGVSYLGMVLNSLDGSWPLASAAYNAGPKRAKAWRAALPRDVEGAIFAETIPFDETRTYVKNVLANATLYDALINGHAQSLKQRLGFINRNGAEIGGNDLP